MKSTVPGRDHPAKPSRRPRHRSAPPEEQEYLEALCELTIAAERRIALRLLQLLYQDPGSQARKVSGEA